MSKLQEDLRIIVGIKEIENRLGKLENLSGIPGQTARIFQGAAGVSTSASGAKGSNSGGNGSASGGGSFGSTRSALGQGGWAWGSGGGSGSSGNSDGSPVSRTADEVIDKAQKEGEKLDKLEVEDCETGAKIIIGETGQFTPPPNWITGEIPPDNYWQLGFMWTNAAMVGTFVSSPSEAAQQYYTVNLGGGAPIGGGDVYEKVGNPFGIITTGSPQFSQKFQQTVSAGVPIPTPTPFTVNILGQACVPGSISSCPIANPGYIPSWPIKNEFQLVRMNGRLVPNKYDPNVPAKYKDGQQSTLNFCFKDGRSGRQENTVDGGFMIYETDSFGAASSDAKLYDANGNYRLAIDKAQIAAYSAANGVQNQT